MKPKPFSELEFRHITLETVTGNIEGLFSELRLDTSSLPEGLIPYHIRSNDAADAVPANIEVRVYVNYFGTLIVNAPLDFSGSDHIEIIDWGFDENNGDDCPEWIKKHLESTVPVKEVKSFIDYFVEKKKIDTDTVQCIRTCGWGDEAVIMVEYADYHKKYKPIGLAKQYLLDVYGVYPKNLNFNNTHYDRIGCSALNVYDLSRENFDKYSTLSTVIHSQYDEKEHFGTLEFAIHNESQCELSYERKLYEYFS